MLLTWRYSGPSLKSPAPIDRFSPPACGIPMSLLPHGDSLLTSQPQGKHKKRLPHANAGRSCNRMHKEAHQTTIPYETVLSSITRHSTKTCRQNSAENIPDLELEQVSDVCSMPYRSHTTTRRHALIGITAPRPSSSAPSATGHTLRAY